MSKRSKRHGMGLKNPVARHAFKFNRSTVFKDRTRYRRTDKNKGLEPFASNLLADVIRVFAKGSLRSCGASGADI